MERAEDFRPYVQALAAGQVVACPTETFHGLLADASSEAAVERVVRLKRRGADPIALLLPDLDAVEQVAEPLTARARELAQFHWPGPLTLVVQALPTLPAPLVQNGKVGVRVPGPSPALELVRAFGRALTATSANLSGQPPARNEAEVRAYFGDGLLMVPGEAPGGVPSTVLDVTQEVPRVLRPGAVYIESEGT